MKVFLVFAHPNPHSLNAALKDHAVHKLQEAGHEVKISDLYAMNWKAVADGDDFPERDRSQPLNYEAVSGEAYRSGTQAPDVVAEQEKLLWADAVILQFPLWWYGMPAILKGWVERVYAKGFAYGRGLHGKAKYGERYGEGILQGKRAMVCVTVGGRVAHYGPRGIGGQIDDLLWPIQHGVLFYPGMTVVPPTLFYEVRKANEEGVRAFCEHYESRLLSLMETEPIPYRTQNGGDYDEYQTVRSEFAADSVGQSVHQSVPLFISNIETTGPADFSPIHFARDSRSIKSCGTDWLQTSSPMS
jgi:NAD(P)H dehydrogenase (quinone)